MLTIAYRIPNVPAMTYCCSPYLDILTTNVLYVTDEVIVPIKIERFALDGYRKTVNEVTAIADDFERNIDISVLFMMVLEIISNAMSSRNLKTARLSKSMRQVFVIKQNLPLKQVLIKK